MAFSTATLDEHLAPVRARGVLEVASLDRRGLLALQSDLAQVRRDLDALFASVASEVARRSSLDDGPDGIARQEGFKTAAQFIASVTGGSPSEADRMIAVGAAMAAREENRRPAAPTVQRPDSHLPDAPNTPPEPTAPPVPRKPELFDAVGAAARAGKLSMEAAAAITKSLQRLRAVADDDEPSDALIDLERRLVEKAIGLALGSVRKMVWRAEANHNPQAWAEKQERAYEERSVTTRYDENGMVHIHAKLDAQHAAPAIAWLDAQVKDAMRRRRDGVIEDDRLPHQMRADAFVSLFSHGLDCDAPTSGVKTTVIVRMRLEDLTSGLGMGEIDGINPPINVGDLRRAAANARIIPEVLGTGDCVLNFGRSLRLFTEAQSLALVERDGGCSSCDAPPSYCESHHIDWWMRDRGKTDLKNGVLLCGSCHHRIHRDGWEVVVRDNVVWFTPPTKIDPTRTPRMGGRARFELDPQRF